MATAACQAQARCRMYREVPRCVDRDRTRARRLAVRDGRQGNGGRERAQRGLRSERRRTAAARCVPQQACSRGRARYCGRPAPASRRTAPRRRLPAIPNRRGYALRSLLSPPSCATRHGDAAEQPDSVPKRLAAMLCGSNDNELKGTLKNLGLSGFQPVNDKIVSRRRHCNRKGNRNRLCPISCSAAFAMTRRRRA